MQPSTRSDPVLKASSRSLAYAAVKVRKSSDTSLNSRTILIKGDHLCPRGSDEHTVARMKIRDHLRRHASDNRLGKSIQQKMR
jgi:hypothetical protein